MKYVNTGETLQPTKSIKIDSIKQVETGLGSTEL